MAVRDAVTELGSLVVIEMVVFSNNRSQMVTSNTRGKTGVVTIMSSKVRVAAGMPDLRRALETFHRIRCSSGTR